MNAHVENTKEFFLSSEDGLALFVRDWEHSNAKEKIGVVIVHGLGEHSGRYSHIARFFYRLGYQVRCFDQRGHGQSEGRRGDSQHHQSHINDLEVVINDFNQQLDQACLVFAHSMGGLFACHFALRAGHQLSGLILSSPALAVKISRFQRYLFTLASKLFPHVGVGHGTNGRYLSHDDEVVYAYQNDPLVHAKISAALFQSMLNSMNYVHQHHHQLKVPLLLLIAGDDQVVDPKGIEQFAQQLDHRLTAASVRTIIYPNFYHEIFNELDAVQAFDDLRTWLDQKNLMPAY